MVKERRLKDNKGKLTKKKTKTCYKRREGRKGRTRLGSERWDPATTNLPAVLSIKIARPFFNFKGFPKFSVMELRNSSNNTGLLNTDVMFGFLLMLCKCGRLGSPMFKVSRMLTNPLINRVSSPTNIGGPTGTRNHIDTLHVLGVDRILH